MYPYNCFLKFAVSHVKWLFSKRLLRLPEYDNSSVFKNNDLLFTSHPLHYYGVAEQVRFSIYMTVSKLSIQDNENKMPFWKIVFISVIKVLGFKKFYFLQTTAHIECIYM